MFFGVFFENIWDLVLCMLNINMLDKINMWIEIWSYVFWLKIFFWFYIYIFYWKFVYIILKLDEGMIKKEFFFIGS